MKNLHQIYNLLVLYVLALLLSACAGPGVAPATATLAASAPPSASATLQPSATPTPAATLTILSSRTPTQQGASPTQQGASPTPILLPTLTATPRLTSSVTATVHVLPTVACDEKGMIQISNTTNAVVELRLTGTGPYLFYLKPGDNSLEVCAGQYNYLAYGCGGESAAGAMSTGETHEFYCK